jgi:hypothetical protein
MTNDTREIARRIKNLRIGIERLEERDTGQITASLTRDVTEDHESSDTVTATVATDFTYRSGEYRFGAYRGP